MSNFHFLKKDLKQKIVKTQGWELFPQQPTAHKWHTIIFSLERLVQERIYTLES